MSSVDAKKKKIAFATPSPPPAMSAPETRGRAAFSKSAGGSGSGSTGSSSSSPPAQPDDTHQPFWATAPSLRQLSADPGFLSSATFQSSAAALATRQPLQGEQPTSSLGLTVTRQQYIDVDGPIDPDTTLIRYDIPFAPKDPRQSLRLRKKLGLLSTTAASGTAQKEDDVDPNVRIVLDSFLLPRRWTDPATGVEWVQHASPCPSSRTDTMETQRLLHAKLEQLGAKRTGTCPIRTVLVAECFLEVMRQVVTENWERGVLLLQIHAERVAAQAAHRELFESRVGHAMRLALKGAKDATRTEDNIEALKTRVRQLEEEEQELRTRCAEFATYAEEQTLIEEKQHAEALGALRKEGLVKRNQLEQLLAVPPPQ